MPLEVFVTNAEYVAALHELEVGGAGGTVRTVASFLSSVYFPQTVLARYFRDHEGGQRIVELLLARQACVRASLGQRREIYEAQAIRNLVVRGEPHEQESTFHISPREITTTLRYLAAALRGPSPVQIGVTREVVPLIFLTTDLDVLIDIRTNYAYQTIQGLRLRDDAGGHAAFVAEFERLWSSPETLTDQAEVRRRIDMSLRDWETAGSLAAERWPAMATGARSRGGA